MEPVVYGYIADVALFLLCILVTTSSIILIINVRKIRKDMHNIWLNSQPFQMARIYEFMGEKDKAVQCYKETLFNVIHKRYSIPGMKRKLQIDYLESKIVALGGRLPDEL
jgi:hypothetical protein